MACLRGVGRADDLGVTEVVLGDPLAVPHDERERRVTALAEQAGDVGADLSERLRVAEIRNLGVVRAADRLGFVLANDLAITNAIVRASPADAAAISQKDRLKELTLYSVSESYLHLRHELGIALGA